jgi:hypothetical protein
MSKLYSFSRHDITEILLKVASNTINQTKRYSFCRCPTDDGKNIMVNLEGPILSQYTRPGTTLQLPASELLMYAFKFKGTTNVGFNCAVRICKKGDENFCKAVSIISFIIILIIEPCFIFENI